jgi:hypothetical protein
MARSGWRPATTSASTIPTCAPFEVVPCDVFITEATFGLPIYRWPDTGEVARDIVAWRDECAARGETAILYCYALGKAQRLLAELAAHTDRPAFLHGAIETGTAIYREAGIPMLETRRIADEPRGSDFAGELVLAPPSAAGSPWIRRFRHAQQGFASGWMRIRGNRRRRNYDRGFVVSDHADWPALLQHRARDRRAPHHRHPRRHRRAGACAERRGIDDRRVPHRLRRRRLMRRFAELFTRLDRSTGTGDKRAALVDYFRDAPPADAAWAFWLLSGEKIGGARADRRQRRVARLDRGGKRARPPGWSTTATTRSATSPKPWPCCSTIRTPAPDDALHAWIEHRLLPVANADAASRRAMVVAGMAHAAVCRSASCSTNC